MQKYSFIINYKWHVINFKYKYLISPNSNRQKQNKKKTIGRKNEQYPQYSFGLDNDSLSSLGQILFGSY